MNNDNKADKKNLLESIKENIKNETIRQKLLKAGLLVAVLFIILSFIIPFSFDPSTFTEETKRNDWIVRTVIMVVLAIYGMLLAEKIAEDQLMGKPNGRYQKKLDEYKQERSKALNNIDDFNDWYLWEVENELRAKKISFLIKNSVGEASAIVDNLDIIEPDELLTKRVKLVKDGKEIVIKKKNEVQVEAIKWVKAENIKIDASGSNWYLNSGESGSSLEMAEEGNRLDKAELSNKMFNRNFKIVSVVFFSFIWGLITVSDFLNLTNAQAWVNLFSRLFGLFTAFIGGWLTSSKTVQIRVKKLENKQLLLFKFNMDMALGRFNANAVYEQQKNKDEEVTINIEEENIDEQSNSD